MIREQLADICENVVPHRAAPRQGRSQLQSPLQPMSESQELGGGKDKAWEQSKGCLQNLLPWALLARNLGGAGEGRWCSTRAVPAVVHAWEGKAWQCRRGDIWVPSSRSTQLPSGPSATLPSPGRGCPLTQCCLQTPKHSHSSQQGLRWHPRTVCPPAFLQSRSSRGGGPCGFGQRGSLEPLEFHRLRAAVTVLCTAVRGITPSLHRARLRDSLVSTASREEDDGAFVPTSLCPR